MIFQLLLSHAAALTRVNIRSTTIILFLFRPFLFYFNSIFFDELENNLGSDLMQSSYRLVSRLLHHHSSKRGVVLSPSFSFDVLEKHSLNNDNFHLFSPATLLRGPCSLHCSKRFVLLGFVSFENGSCHYRSQRQYRQFFSYRSKFTTSLFFKKKKNHILRTYLIRLTVFVIGDFFTRAKQVKKIEFNDEHRCGHFIWIFFNLYLNYFFLLCVSHQILLLFALLTWLEYVS